VKRCSAFAQTLACLLVFLTSWSAASAQFSTRNNSSGQRAVAAAPATYRIATNDSLRIVIFQEPDLEVTARVDANGMVNQPLLGQIRLAGYTIPEAEQAIARAYQNERYLRSPQVTIAIVDYAPREVTIQGQVGSPGRYPLPVEHTMTLVELVTRAGGLKDVARGSAVIVTRPKPDGTFETFKVDVDSLIKGRSRAKAEDNTFTLQQGDIVYVPERII